MNQPFPGGFLLAIEGIDGAGKSSQVEAVARVLSARGLACLTTREPTDGRWGRILRESAAQGRLSPEEELEAFLEDRKEHVRKLIRPSLAAGKIVLTDRYYFSTVAYQGARGYDPDELLRRNEAVAIEPHLLVIIDMDPDTGLARVGNRDGAANFFESHAQLSRSREIFLSIRKPYAHRVEGRNRPDDIRDDILLAFARKAMDNLAANPDLTSREKLDASLALHGAAPTPD